VKGATSPRDPGASPGKAPMPTKDWRPMYEQRSAILRAHVPGALPHYVGPEIWHVPLGDAIALEAETIADHAGPEMLSSPVRRGREEPRERVVEEMTEALVDVGDTYLAPDGVRYSLSDEEGLDLGADEGRLDHEMSAGEQRPTVVEVLRFEDLPLGSGASRRAVVRWSDGTEGEAVRFYADEVLMSEGDHGNLQLMARGSRSPRRQRYWSLRRGT
jgi:hypothetical protein